LILIVSTLIGLAGLIASVIWRSVFYMRWGGGGRDRGNAVVVIASEKFPLPAATFAEILATSDLPGGVVNILTGKRAELVPHIASHLDVNAIVDGTGDTDLGPKLQAGTASNLKRYANHSLPSTSWFTAKAEDPYWILDTVEFKTAWHPIGL